MCKQSNFIPLALTLLCLTSSFAQDALVQQAKESIGTAVTPEAHRVTMDLIGPSDTLGITVLGSEELSKSWRVDAAGRVNLPMVGTMEAAGMSPGDFQRELQTRLKKYFIDPQVLVYVSDTRSRPVTITGAVEHPGVYQLQDARTLAQVLLLAAGPKDPGPTVTVSRALSSGVLTDPRVRVEGSNQILELPLVDVLTGHGSAAETQIIPNDVVSVATVKAFRMVQIMGEVQRPGSIELVNHTSISLIEALGMAGGMTKVAKPRKAVILHMDKDGNSTPEPVDIRKVMKGELSGVMLKSGDVVVIPSSTVASLIQTASTAGVTSGLFLLGRF